MQRSFLDELVVGFLALFFVLAIAEAGQTRIDCDAEDGEFLSDHWRRKGADGPDAAWVQCLFGKPNACAYGRVGGLMSSTSKAIPTQRGTYCVGESFEGENVIHDCQVDAKTPSVATITHANADATLRQQVKDLVKAKKIKKHTSTDCSARADFSEVEDAELGRFVEHAKSECAAADNAACPFKFDAKLVDGLAATGSFFGFTHETGTKKISFHVYIKAAANTIGVQTYPAELRDATSVVLSATVTVSQKYRDLIDYDYHYYPIKDGKVKATCRIGVVDAVKYAAANGGTAVSEATLKILHPLAMTVPQQVGVLLSNYFKK